MAVSSISAAENLSMKKVGRIDALANNTGMNDGVGFEKRTSNQFIASLQRNLSHYGNMAHSRAATFEAHRWIHGPPRLSPAGFV